MHYFLKPSRKTCTIKTNEVELMFHNDTLYATKTMSRFVLCAFYPLVYLECAWYILTDIKDRRVSKCQSPFILSINKNGK